MRVVHTGRNDAVAGRCSGTRCLAFIGRAISKKKARDGRSQLRVNTQMVSDRVSGAVGSVGGVWITGKQTHVAEVTWR